MRIKCVLLFNNYDNDPIGLIVRLKYPKALANGASSTKLRNPRRLFRARENIKRASQSELKLKTREMFKARENASGQDATCLSFEFDWLRRWHDFFWTNCTAMWSKTEEVLNYLRHPEKKNCSSWQITDAIRSAIFYSIAYHLPFYFLP